MFRIVLIALAGSGLMLAQDQRPVNPQPAPSTGGWRRVGEQAPNPQRDPEPVARDSYGQASGPDAQDPGPPPMVNQQVPQRNDRPAYGLPPQVTLQPGTFVTVRINQPLSSDHNQPGDTFSASLAQPVVVDGVVIASRGGMVYGRVAEAQKAHSDRASRLALELTSMTLADGSQVNIRSQLVGRQGGSTPVGEQVGTVAGTTAIGAGIGAVADWGRGAAIGAAAGATAGIIGVLLTRNHPTEIYPETALTFRVDSPVVVSTVRAPQAFRYVDPYEYERQPVTAGPPALRPRPAPPAYYGPGPYPYPYGYPGYFYGPGVSVVFGPGYVYGHGYGYRGYYRRYH